MRTSIKAAVSVGAGTAIVVLAVTPASAAKPDRATGQVTWITQGSADASATFVAQDFGEGDVRGDVTVINHDGVSFTGTVTCFAVQPDGSVAFGGEIVDSSGTSTNGQPADAYYVIRVVDRGEPGNVAAGAVTPDQINLLRTNDSTPCSDPYNVLQPVQTGNLQTYVATN